MILGYNIFTIFVLFILIDAKFYPKFSLNLTYYISQHKSFLLWFFNCFYFCQDSTSTSKFLVLIVLFSLNCLQLRRFKAKCCRYFSSLDFCELIREKFDGFLSFILHALFYVMILIYSSLHVVFFLNLKVLSYIISFIYAFCKHKILAYYRF